MDGLLGWNARRSFEKAVRGCPVRKFVRTFDTLLEEHMGGHMLTNGNLLRICSNAVHLE